MAEGQGSTGRGELDAEPADDSVSGLPSWLSGTGEVDAPEAVEPCRFLAVVSADGVLEPPVPAVDDANRCVALGDPAPQSARQQELVCLGAAHRTCPRYLRGTLLESSPPPTAARERVSVVVIASWLALATAIAASFGFLAVRGGLTVALISPSPERSQVAVIPAASVTADESATPSSIVSPEPTPLATPSQSGPPSLSPSVAPTPAPSATPAPTATARPSSDRYAVLEPCPSTPDCWIYTVRSGDNLVSIAHWFGVPLETVYDMNPWARTNGLRPGQELRLPPPTR